MHFNVPAYSQYLDVKNRAWKSRSCGIAALKMVMDFLEPRRAATRTLPRLIRARTRAHAYVRNIGWSHAGLARIAIRYGLKSKNYDWFRESPRNALKKMTRFLKHGPVIASIHRKLNPNAHGHLVVITRFHKNTIFYHDPDSKTRNSIPRKAPLKKFLRGWKRRIIVVRI